MALYVAVPLLLQVGMSCLSWCNLYLPCSSCVLASSNHLSIIYLAYSPSLDTECRDASNGSYSFDNSVFYNTVVTEFNLVCSKAVLLPTITFSYMLGIAIINLMAGALSDALGRRVLVLVVVTVNIISSFVTWLSPSFWVFLLGRVFVGGSIHTTWAGMFILLQEITPSQHRALTAGVMNLGNKAQSTRHSHYLIIYFRMEHWLHVDLFPCLLHS